MGFEHSGLEDNGKNNIIEVHPTAQIESTVKIIFKGDGHSLRIGEGVVLRNMQILFSGAMNSVDIGVECNLRGSIHVRQKQSTVAIGDGTTFVSANLFAMEGRRIQIGGGCMFSSGIYIRTSDEHPIFDLSTGERLNQAADVVIGSMVWLGEGATISKGCSVADGCVVGARSYVSKRLSRPNAIYAGSPARLIREGVRWDRKL
jgi:acetyltransferase-like isoleucine patch superfamily enzyme